MEIIVHPMVAAQRAVLELPVEQRRTAMRSMLAPFDPMLRIMVPPGGDPTTMFGFMRPEGPTAEYARALAALDAAGAESTCLEALNRSVGAFAAAGYHPPFDRVHFGLFLLDTNPQIMRLSQGYTGFGGIPGYIMVSLWPDDRNLPKLGAAVAHEFNHQIRLSVEPWRMDISVGEYLVHEGLAESFAAELYGPEFVGPWITEVSPADLEAARTVLGSALGIRGFNEVRPYIFGDEVMAAFGGARAVGVPAYAGYVAGFHLLQTYLRKTGQTAAQATLVPSAEIVRTAGFF